MPACPPPHPPPPPPPPPPLFFSSPPSVREEVLHQIAGRSTRSEFCVREPLRPRARPPSNLSVTDIQRVLPSRNFIFLAALDARTTRISFPLSVMILVHITRYFGARPAYGSVRSLPESTPTFCPFPGNIPIHPLRLAPPNQGQCAARARTPPRMTLRKGRPTPSCPS